MAFLAADHIRDDAGKAPFRAGVKAQKGIAFL
jgi:hypothetical protein